MLLFTLPAHAQFVSQEPKQVIDVFEAMYRYDLPVAEQKLKALYATTIDQDWIDLAYVNLMWWWLISGDESRDYDNLMKVALNKVIARAEASVQRPMPNNRVFTLIHSYAYLTRVDIYQERYLRGIGNLKSTLKYLETALDKYNEYDKFMLVSGLYNYFAAVTVRVYPIFTPFFAFAPKSDRELGFRLLQQCSRMDHVLLRTESLYYLMKINYQLEEKYDDALAVADRLTRDYPNNLIFHFHRFMILIEAGRKPEARSQFLRLKEISGSAPGLNPMQRKHLVEIAEKRLRKERINPAI